MAPTTKKIDRPIRTFAPPSLTGRISNTTKTIRTNALSVLNCRFRYAAAPSWTARAMSCIRGVP